MSEVIRILHVFGRLDRGGAETMIMNLYRNIDRTKIQFDFIIHTKDKCDYEDEIRFLGGRIYSIPRYKGKNHREYKNIWNDFLKQHNEYKIIHGHVRSTAAIYLSIAKKYKLKTISHSHNTSSGKGIVAIFKNLLQYPIRYKADYLFACSKSAGEWLFGEKACKSKKFYILKNAIDSEKFIFNKEIRIEKRKELNLQDNYVIGHIGRFHPQKNHDFLINVFKKVHEKNKNSVLLLIGDGELKKSIENNVKKLGIEKNVIFTGGRSDITELLQAMDLFVLPSLYEGLGIVVIEAQASGLHCVVSDNVPKETNITKNVKYISLKESQRYWSQIILKYFEGYNRKNTKDKIIDSGYDIKETSKWIEKFYFKMLKE